MTPDDVMDRIVAKTEMRGECIEWTGYRDARGYGRIWFNGENRFVHRIAYQAIVGDIAQGLHLDHLCRNPACCRVDHLEAVTPRENILRGVAPAAHNARKTRCKRGHPLEGENLHVGPNGYRVCITCRSERDKARRSTAEYRRRHAAYCREYRAKREAA